MSNILADNIMDIMFTYISLILIHYIAKELGHLPLHTHEL